MLDWQVLMEQPPVKNESRPRTLRFGGFEVDPRTQELRKQGIRVRLPAQSIQILLMLLETPGELVNREELRKKLWPQDTFVDFDHGVNAAVNRLREALGDSAEEPKFIETLPRRGYRFIAPVDIPSTPAAPAPTDSESGKTPTTGAAAVAHTASAKPARWLTWSAAALLVLCTALFGVWLRAPLPPPRILGSKQLTNDGIPKTGSSVTDGTRIYFNELLPSGVRVAQVSSRGGETALVALPFPFGFVCDVSPEQSELIVLEFTTMPDEGPFWSVPVPAGPPRKLGDTFGHDAKWAPNGKLIFAKGNDIYVAEHDGANPRKLITAPGFPDDVSVSPDGNRLSFQVWDENRTSALWEVRADGSDMHPLFPGWHNPPEEDRGNWSPDGRYYAFESFPDRQSNIWVVRERSPWWGKLTREPVQLTVGPLQFFNPVFNKDGKKLFVIGMELRAELVRYDAKSGEFVPFLGGVSAGDVEVSRDGQWVTYVSYPDYALWRSKVDGSDRLQLTYPPMQATDPHWSPDGQQIAFSGIVSGKPRKVYLIPKDGGSPQGLTADEIDETDPTWLPDGGTLAFGHWDQRHSEQTFVRLFNLQTRQISELPGSRYIMGPRWSPDGRYIVAFTHENDKLMLYDVEIQRWRELAARLKALLGKVFWSSDSAYVYFDAHSSGDTACYRLRISDSKIERLVDMKRIRLFNDPHSGGQTLTGLGPGNTPLFARDTSVQEIYALDVQLP